MDYKKILAERLKSPGAKKTATKKTAEKPTGKKETIPPGRRIVTLPSSGVNGADVPQTTQEKKTYEEYRGKLIANEAALRNLVEKSLIISILGELGQAIQNNIVDQAKRKSSDWAAQLGCPEKEREIEMLLTDLGEEEINGMVADIEKFCKKEIYE